MQELNRCSAVKTWKRSRAAVLKCKIQSRCFSLTKEIAEGVIVAPFFSPLALLQRLWDGRLSHVSEAAFSCL